ncbi:Cysteine proteinase inhibitor 12-like protein [Drosera capensis]
MIINPDCCEGIINCTVKYTTRVGFGGLERRVTTLITDMHTQRSEKEEEEERTRPLDQWQRQATRSHQKSLISACGTLALATGEQEVPPEDPQVQEAADHAVKSISRMSNSLFPYQLLNILHAKTEVIEDFVKYKLLLKLKRNIHEEKFAVEVQKTSHGELKLLKQSKHDEAQVSDTGSLGVFGIGLPIGQANIVAS